MKIHLLRALSIAILMFAVGYFVWQHGRMVGLNERGDRLYINCAVIQDSEEMECELYELNTPELIKAYERYTQVYEQVLKEIDNPSRPEKWIEEYETRMEKKLGL